MHDTICVSVQYYLYIIETFTFVKYYLRKVLQKEKHLAKENS